MTTFADGLYQFGGAPVGPGSMATSKLFNSMTGSQRIGRAWFVNPTGSVNGNGKSGAGAFATMQQAFDACDSGDIIYFVGKVTEQLVTPANVFDVTVVGCGNRPRHADASPAGGDWATGQWGPPASGAVSGQATVRVIQQGWRFVNILFTMESATAAGIELVRNAAAGDLERDASHASILGCRFAGAGVGIRSGVAGLFTEIVFNVQIEGCVFNGCTVAIGGINGNMWTIKNNDFPTNTSVIICPFQGTTIGPGNTINVFTAAGNSGGIYLDGGAGTNFVTGNYLGGAFSIAGGYNGETGDNWWGNFANVTGGVTQADPA